MALSLNELREIMAPLSELGKGDGKFEVNGLQITLRTLTPEEEVTTQRYAKGALVEGETNDQINAMDYLDRFRASCLGYSIIQIGDADFRDVDTVETGEKLASGVAVKIKKHEAVMKVMEGWSRTMMTAVFQRFTSLVARIEADVEKSLKYDDDHIDAEIIRLEEKLAELKTTKVRRDAGQYDSRQEAMDAAANKPRPVPDKPVEKPTWETADSTHSTDESPAFVAVPSDIPRTLEEKPAVPSEGKPESLKEAVAPVPDGPKEPRKPVFGDRPVPREPVHREPPDPLKDVQSSLVDTSDPDVIEAENRRLMAERLRRMAPKPPHQSARETAQAIEQAGTMDGVPVFKMPVQELNPETAGRPARKPPPVVVSTVNPKFIPAK